MSLFSQFFSTVTNFFTSLLSEPPSTLAELAFLYMGAFLAFVLALWHWVRKAMIKAWMFACNDLRRYFWLFLCWISWMRTKPTLVMYGTRVPNLELREDGHHYTLGLRAKLSRHTDRPMTINFSGLCINFRQALGLHIPSSLHLSFNPNESIGFRNLALIDLPGPAPSYDIQLVFTGFKPPYPLAAPIDFNQRHSMSWTSIYVIADYVRAPMAGWRLKPKFGEEAV